MREIENYYSIDILKNCELFNQSNIKRSFLTNVIGSFTCMALTYDQNFFVSGGLDGVVRVWDVQNLKNINYLIKHKTPVISLATSSKSDLIISGGSLICLWKFKENKILKILKFHKYPINTIKIDSSDLQAFSGDSFENLNIWSLKTYEIIYYLSGSEINSLISFGFLTSKFFKAKNKTVSILNTKMKIEKSYNSSSKINCFHLFNNELCALLGLDDGSVVLLESCSCSEIEVIRKSSSKCIALNSSRNDKYFASFHLNYFLFIYSVENCEALRSLEMDGKYLHFEILNSLAYAVYMSSSTIFRLNLNTYEIKDSKFKCFYHYSLALASDNTFIVFQAKILLLVYGMFQIK